MCGLYIYNNIFVRYFLCGIHSETAMKFLSDSKEHQTELPRYANSTVIVFTDNH